MDFGASYEEAVSQGLAGLAGGYSETAGKAMKMLGMQLTTKALTAQVWQGSTEVAFSIPLVFQAESNVNDDVTKPLSDLYRLVLPREPDVGGLLQAPGPQLDLDRLKKQSIDFNLKNTVTSGASTLGSALTFDKSTLTSAFATASEAGKGLQSFSQAFMGSIKNNISLKIGTRVFLSSVVITSVSSNTSVLPTRDGSFQRQEVTVGFKTFYVLTQNDIPNLVSYSGR